MLRIFNTAGKSLLIAAFAVLASLGSVHAGNFAVLYVFKGPKGGLWGDIPGQLISDRAGNLYGTTEFGGGSDDGTVFKFAPGGTETVLYSFKGNQSGDGANPLGALAMDNAGNLYGTTYDGGSTGCNSIGCGTVFKVAPNGTETVLHVFSGSPDGLVPRGGLIADKKGNLYGTTNNGGALANCTYGCGTVFKIAPNGTETVLYSFCSNANDPECSDGAFPIAGLMADSAGNLYGTTTYGGAHGGGDVFRLAPDGTETVLYSFCSQAHCSDGTYPTATLVADKGGNLYGTTIEAGNQSNGGAAFRLAPDGTYTVLYSFCSQSNCIDGSGPDSGALVYQDGNLYGSTGGGGKNNGGVVYKLAADGIETVLHSFRPKRDGDGPQMVLFRDGHLFGAAAGSGPYRSGTLFELDK